MFKIFADECINLDVIFALRQSGFDTLTVKDAELTGSDDETIFEFACENKRILLTYDRGFGDIFRFDMSKSGGVIIVLTGKMEKNEIVNIVLTFISTINKQADLCGKLVIIGKSKIRITER